MYTYTYYTRGTIFISVNKHQGDLGHGLSTELGSLRRRRRGAYAVNVVAL